MSSSPTTALVARTVRLAGDVDLLAVAGDEGVLFVREGAGFAGRGEALRIELPTGLADAATVTEALAAIEVDGDLPPLAVGALPFDPSRPGSLVVPELVVRRTPDGTAWLTTVGDVAGDLSPTGPRRWPPDAFTLTPCMRHEDWCAVVEGAVADIRAGQLDKVVLAREIVVEANAPIVVSDVLARLRALYPSTMVFSVDGFVGASPELLVSRFGTRVRSHPLAGTIPHSGDPVADRRMADALLASDKDRHEHRLVVDAVVEALGPLTSSLDVPDAPAIVPLRNVAHLGTVIEGELTEPAPSALELAARLHPTPAVGGTPTAAALRYIAAVEGFDRGRFAGPVGWVDANGDGAWAVGIRSASIDGATARLRAGVGVVADSDPRAELAETQLKLQALLAAVVRP